MQLTNSIKYANLDSLNEVEKAELREIATKEFEKISRLIKNDFNLLVHPKVYTKEKGRKYSIHLQIEAPTKMYSTEAAGWDLRLTAHEATKKIKNELSKSLKTKTLRKKFEAKKIKSLFSVIRRK